MKGRLNKLLSLLIIFSYTVILADTYIPTIEDKQPIQMIADCTINNNSYVPNIGKSLFTVYSKDHFSPTKLNMGWITGDHIGEKDTAFSGERHVALYNPGVVMSGYDALPHADFMIKDFGDGDKTINVIQGPYQVDWHTFNGNGILFNVTLSKDLEPGDYLPGNVGATISNGYFLCATRDKLRLIQLNGISLDSLLEDSSFIANMGAIWECKKECPAQNFTIVVKGNQAIGYLGQLEIFKTNVQNGKYCGLLSCYAGHNCSKLSSIYFSNFTYNGKDYLST